nr:PREDICTED: 5-hydroxytryptamine receptor 6 [Lepisosteus oculatus]
MEAGGNESLPWPRGAAGGGSGWVAAALSLIVLLTVAGNTLLILLICTQRALRSTSNYFLVSLFMSDLMVGLAVMPPAMLNALCGRWVLAPGLCSVWVSFDVMCCSASILNLCLISLDRYLLIICPLRYKLRMTPGRALLLILAAWSLAALASFLPIEMGWHALGAPPLPAPGECRLRVSLPFALVASCLTFFLPSAAISFTYCRILLAARRQARQVASLATALALAPPAQHPHPSPPCPGGSGERRLAHRHGRRALKASLTLGVLLGLFFVAWLPFFISNMAQAVCECDSPALFDVLTWLGYCNSTMNPIIYPLFIRDFKRALGRYLPCCPPSWTRRPSPLSVSVRNSPSGYRGDPPLPSPSPSPSPASLTSDPTDPSDPTHHPPCKREPPATATDAVNLFDMEHAGNDSLLPCQVGPLND